MKQPSDFLWQLIKSLDRNEKLFIRRNFLSRSAQEGKVYVQLFDAISTQKTYNEDFILKRLGPALNRTNISSQKHYLQQLICESLIRYEGRDSVSQEIFNQILLVRIFRKKGLLEDAHNTWRKAVSLAQETESLALLNLLKTEFEKMILFSSVHTRYDELHTLLKKNVVNHKEYTNIIALGDIYAETILLKRKTHFEIGPQLKTKIESLLKQVEKHSAALKSPSFWFRHYYLINKATLLYLLNRIPASSQVLRQLLAIWHEKPHFMKTEGEHYVELMYMINYAVVKEGDYSYVMQVFNDKKNDLITEPLQRANFEAIKYLAFNKIYNKTARYDEVDKLVRFMKVKYVQWEPLLNSDMNQTVNLSLGIASFALERYDDALYFTKRGITYFKDGTREEHSSLAQILLLLISYCIDNDRLFDSQYRATYTYFYKRKKKQPFESALVSCLHRSFYMKDNKRKVKEYQKALQVFEENKENEVQQAMVSIFNYPAWLQSRAERIPYQKFIERKVKDGLISG